jgi:aspartyl/asparaginyl beta-hydroxylase (cupin superfamily)
MPRKQIYRLRARRRHNLARQQVKPRASLTKMMMLIAIFLFLPKKWN